VYFFTSYAIGFTALKGGHKQGERSRRQREVQTSYAKKINPLKKLLHWLDCSPGEVANRERGSRQRGV